MIHEIGRFWRLLLQNTSPSQILLVNSLVLLASVSEGFMLGLLLPLLHALDPSGRPTEESGAALARILRYFDIQPNLSGVLGIFLSFVVIRSLINRQRQLYFNALRLYVVRGIRIALYSGIAHANWLFLKKMRTSDLLSALTTETDRIDRAIHYSLEMPGRATMIGAHVVVAFLIAPALTLLALATGIILAWLVRGRLVESLRIGKALSEAYKQFHLQISELLAGLKITKSYCAEDPYVTAFAEAINNVNDSFLSYLRSQQNARLFQEISAAGAVAIFLWISAGQLRMPVADVLLLALILYRLLPLVQSLQQTAQELMHLAPSAQAILDLLNALEGAREPSHGQTQRRLSIREGIRFEKVGFSHQEDSSETISNASFRLPAGTLTVLSGASGAGKSTLLDLIAGLLRPSEGRIWIDELELTEERAQTWRASIAYVLQDPFLFHDTIRANLLIAKRNATERELQEALTCAGAAAFVNALPRGMETIVGDRGYRFSGGERQRLALARALLRRPSLLLLDEPTSSLDEENERFVLEGIEELKGHTTLILVTHRPERVRSADQTLFIEDGKIGPVHLMGAGGDRCVSSSTEPRAGLANSDSSLSGFSA